MSGLDWPGLLKWSLKYSDGTKTEKKTISKEDLEFLEAAFKSAFEQNDPTKVIEEARENLLRNDDGSILAALDVIERSIDYYPEIARNFHKYDLIEIFLTILKSENQNIVYECLQILSLVLANNDVLQSELMKYDGLNILIKILHPKIDNKIATSVIGAISSIIRNNSAAESWFFQANGMFLLLEGMHIFGKRFQEKSMTLLTYLMHSDWLQFTTIVEVNLTQYIINQLKKKDIDNEGIQYGEILAQLTYSLIEKHRFNLQKHKYTDSLKNSIEERLNYLNQVDFNINCDVGVEKSYLIDSLKFLSFTRKTNSKRK